jgi:hypothetical protein
MSEGPVTGGQFMEATSPVRDALTRIQIEYVEMPQLRLTARQVRRL